MEQLSKLSPFLPFFLPHKTQLRFLKCSVLRLSGNGRKPRSLDSLAMWVCKIRQWEPRHPTVYLKHLLAPTPNNCFQLTYTTSSQISLAEIICSTHAVHCSSQHNSTYQSGLSQLSWGITGFATFMFCKYQLMCYVGHRVSVQPVFANTDGIPNFSRSCWVLGAITCQAGPLFRALYLHLVTQIQPSRKEDRSVRHQSQGGSWEKRTHHYFSSLLQAFYHIQM